MATERHYIVRITGGFLFDETTVSTVTDAWLPAPQDQPAQKLRSLSIAQNRGRFPAALLGKTNNSISLVRVFQDGPFQPTDRYAVVGASTTVAADGIVRADPILIPRSVAVALGNKWATALPLELGPTDELIIKSERPTTVHIVVYDLDEREAFDWTMRVAETAERDPVSTRVQAAAGTLASWVGTLYVAATAAAAGDTMTLPLLADIAEGDKVTVYRDGGAWFQVDGNGVEEINGSTSPVRFIADGQGETFERTSVGWTSTSAANSTALVALTDSAAFPTITRARTHVQWTITANAALILPSIATVPIDAEVTVAVVSIAAGSRFYIAPTAGEAIDIEVNKQLTVSKPGDSILLRRVDGGWISLRNDQVIDQNLVAVVTDPLLGATGGWVGLRAYSCAYGGVGNFTLPTAPKNGTEIVVYQTTASTVTLDAGANTIAAGTAAATTKALTQHVQMHLQFFGVAGVGVWVAL